MSQQMMGKLYALAKLCPPLAYARSSFDCGPQTENYIKGGFCNVQSEQNPPGTMVIIIFACMVGLRLR